MKILTLTLMISMGYQNIFSQNDRLYLSVEASPLLLYIYPDNPNSSHKNKVNYLVGVDASYFFLNKKIYLGISSGLFFKTKNYYTEHWNVTPTNEPITTSNKYTYLSVPVTLKSKINLNERWFTFIEAGIFLNQIISKDYLIQYPDGTSNSTLPNDLQYEYLNELYFAVSIGRAISSSGMSIELKPYILYKYKEEIYYRQSFYNLGRTGIGVSFVFNFFTIKK